MANNHALAVDEEEDEDGDEDEDGAFFLLIWILRARLH